jgi:hypothetical protein
MGVLILIVLILLLIGGGGFGYRRYGYGGGIGIGGVLLIVLIVFAPLPSSRAVLEAGRGRGCRVAAFLRTAAHGTGAKAGPVAARLVQDRRSAP